MTPQQNKTLLTLVEIWFKAEGTRSVCFRENRETKAQKTHSTSVPMEVDEHMLSLIQTLNSFGTQLTFYDSRSARKAT